MEKMLLPLLHVLVGLLLYVLLQKKSEFVLVKSSYCDVKLSNRPALRRCVKNSPPTMYSRSRYRYCESWKQPNRFTMNGCDNDIRMDFSEAM